MGPTATGLPLGVATRATGAGADAGAGASPPSSSGSLATRCRRRAGRSRDRVGGDDAVIDTALELRGSCSRRTRRAGRASGRGATRGESAPTTMYCIASPSNVQRRARRNAAHAASHSAACARSAIGPARSTRRATSARQPRQIDRAAVVDRQQRAARSSSDPSRKPNRRAARGRHRSTRRDGRCGGRRRARGRTRAPIKPQHRRNDDPEDERTHHSHVQMVGRRARRLDHDQPHRNTV